MRSFRKGLPGILILGLLIPFGCRTPDVVPPPAAPALQMAEISTGPDPHSWARPDQVAIQHLALDLSVDFPHQRLSGTATLTLDNHGADRLYLDTRDLEIRSVSLGDAHTPARYSLGESRPYLGSPLMVEITPETRTVTIDYQTSPQAAALQWLDADQTLGKRHPFLFTQSESILARTWVPCQDTPTVRMTYQATIHVPEGMMAVMSAKNVQSIEPDGVYHLEMPQPIPSYLLALAVGDLEFRPLGPRSGVYAEPQMIERAAWELADTPKFINAAEELYGPYRWGRYDILVLPPSFPFGGMENPRLTFATPTIIAGDRSLVSLIAHELAHSWSGNLVTNATWNDFWLNEGFTDYFTQRIIEKVYGRDYAEMLALLEYRDLQDEVERLGATSPDTRLHLDLAGRDPDEGMSDIPYAKGYFLLRKLEETFGRERWDQFLRGYFDRFAFHSMTTEKFLDYLHQQLLDPNPELAAKVDVNQWIYQPGIPSNIPKVESAAFDRVDEQVAAFRNGADASTLRTTGWSTHEWIHFLRNLPDSMSAEQMRDLDATFNFSTTGNSEILFAWLMHVVPSRYEPAYPALERFLVGQGRLKFIMPLYGALVKTDEGLTMAQSIYRKARSGYHPLGQSAVDALLKKAKQ